MTALRKQGRRGSEKGSSRLSPRRILGVLGPGLVTGAADDDPGGIGTFVQVGSQFGYGLLWASILILPLMAAVQELCARIALETRVGLGVSLRRKFPRWLVGVSVLGLVVANTFNLGADLGAVAAGADLLTRGTVKAIWLLVPIAVGVVAFQVLGKYELIFKTFKWLTLVLFAYLGAAILARPNLVQLVTEGLVPHPQFSLAYVSAITAMLGTSISPYLFFWQAASEVEEDNKDKQRPPGPHRLSWQRLLDARTDVFVGMVVAQAVMLCILITSAAVLHAHGKTDVQSAEQAASTLAPIAGPFAFVLFAVGLIGTGLLAIPVLSGSAAYAVREFFRWRESFDSSLVEGWHFYGVIVVATGVGVALNLVGINAIKALFISAVINGMVAPPLLVLIVLLGSDQRLMGGSTSRGWSRSLGWTAVIVMGAAALMEVFSLVVARNGP
jgi:NRAMP (natural resistance-associated macrophage protein)-like metal ion transporter